MLGVLLVLLALIVAIIIFVVTSLNKINRVDPNAETLSKEEWEQMRETDELDPNATYPAVDEDSIRFPRRRMARPLAQRITLSIFCSLDRTAGREKAALVPTP